MFRMIKVSREVANIIELGVNDYRAFRAGLNAILATLAKLLVDNNFPFLVSAHNEPF